MKPDVVFLDFGDTLAYLARRREDTISEALVALGHAITPQQVEQPLATARHEYSTQTPHNRDLPGRREFYVGMYQVVAERLGFGAGARKIAEHLWDTQPECWALFDDVVPALQALRDAGARLGIISNWDKLNLAEVCGNLGVAGFFDVIIPSASVDADKPNPVIFHRAMAMVGVEPGACVHVGDSFGADIQGARNAGIVGILIQRDGDEPYDCPTVPRLDDLVELIAEL